jgi:signal transduction histidine kinase
VVVLSCLAEFSHVLPGRVVKPLPEGPWWDLWYPALVAIVPGLAFVLAGMIGWSIRPQNLVGLLMIGVGVGLLTPDLSMGIYNSWPPALKLLFFLGWLAQAMGSRLWLVVLIHLLLAFPGGSLISRLDRTAIRFLYAVALIVAFFDMAVTVSFALEQPFRPLPPIIADLASATGLIYQASLFVGQGLVIRRWLLGGRARRRSMSPLYGPVVLVTVAFIFLTATGFMWRNQVPPNPVLLAADTSAALVYVALPVGFLIGLLRSGLDMSSVGDLVVQLSGGLSPVQLQPALAQALHDPSLEVAYWLSDQKWFVDLGGTRIELPAANSERAASVLGDLDSPVAALVYDSSLVHERQLVDTAGAAVRLALENARLQVRLRAQLEEVRRSRARLVEAADNERQRVERDLHDGAQQQLVTLLLSLQATKTEALRQSDPETARLVDANIAELRQALDELRELARGIHPTVLTQAGLVPAIRSLTERCPIPVDVKGDLGDARLAPPLEATLYFVVAEAITNAVKHSKGRRMCVSLARDASVAAIDVSDDGVGGADQSLGSGLRGLTDRVAAVGGRLMIKSDPESGTTIHAEVPCA